MGNQPGRELMSKADEIAAEIVALMRVLVDLGDYTRKDLVELVDEAIEREGNGK
jgi:hypothetical protein